jgi:hypothetical protein
MYWRDISISSLAELLIPISSFFYLQIFKIAKRLKDFSRDAEKKLNLSASLDCLFIEIFRGHFKKLLESVKCDFFEISYIQYIISPICFHLHCGENGKYNISSKNHLKSINKTNRGF